MKIDSGRAKTGAATAIGAGITAGGNSRIIIPVNMPSGGDSLDGKKFFRRQHIGICRYPINRHDTAMKAADAAMGAGIHADGSFDGPVRIIRPGLRRPCPDHQIQRYGNEMKKFG